MKTLMYQQACLVFKDLIELLYHDNMTKSKLIHCTKHCHGKQTYARELLSAAKMEDRLFSVRPKICKISNWTYLDKCTVSLKMLLALVFDSAQEYCQHPRHHSDCPTPSQLPS